MTVKCATCGAEHDATTAWFVPRTPRVYVCNAHQCVAPITMGAIVQVGSKLEPRADGGWYVSRPDGGPVRMVSGCEALMMRRKLDTKAEP